MIEFYGYAIKKDGKYLGFNPKRDKRGKSRLKDFYKRPMFPVVNGERFSYEEACIYSGEVVKVKLTMEEVQ